MEHMRSLEHILLPSTIEFHPGDRPNVGQLVITPCYQGYGTTLGNALRRVLLSSLSGAAVEAVKIKGVQHEFSPISGVLEDVIEIILNLKQLAVRSHVDAPVTLSLTKKGKGMVTAADFDKNPDVEIINTDAKIATVTDDKTTFDMEVTIGRGYGYVPVAERPAKQVDLGTVAIDSLYSPIRDVGYNIELTRVGDVTNYEKLTLTIETNGTITPKEAVSQATQILMDHFTLILGVATGEAESGEPVADMTEWPAAADEAAASDAAPVAAGMPALEVSEADSRAEETPKKKKTKKSKKGE